MKLSIVSTHRGRHFLLFLTDTLVRSLEAAHVRRRTKTIQRKHSLWKHILLFTHCRPRSRAQKLPSNSLSLSLSLSWNRVASAVWPTGISQFQFMRRRKPHSSFSRVHLGSHLFFFFFFFTVGADSSWVSHGSHLVTVYFAFVYSRVSGSFGWFSENMCVSLTRGIAQTSGLLHRAPLSTPLPIHTTFLPPLHIKIRFFRQG